MTTGRMRSLLLLTVAVITVLLVFSRNPSTQATSPASPNYDYKVEFVKHHQNLEGLLKEDARSGWRVKQVLATAYYSDLVVVLEKAAVTP